MGAPGNPGQDSKPTHPQGKKKEKIGINSQEGARPTHLGFHCLELGHPVFVCILTKGQFND